MRSILSFPSLQNGILLTESFLAGASAGGHLALLHAYKHQGTGNIQAVIAFFPPTDCLE